MTAFYSINEFNNTLYGINSYQILDLGCKTSTGAAAFVNAANIISTLRDGKLKVLLTNTAIQTTYHFCLKVTDDSGLGYFEVIDNLSLKVSNCDISF